MITVPREATIRVTPTYLIITGPQAEVGYKKTPTGYAVEVREPRKAPRTERFGPHNTSAWRYAIVAAGFATAGHFADGDDTGDC